ncbi:hypothetical protein KC717_01765 [Candidatus Dojkabacteria bacterium]|uniref:Uncharacterized protein n=1 Tax=Candidatus Dojkabacteria bacterium TaxID=2099670 RepID=A0A955L7E8_9BACT|nr:hypothetical protein [Candidatus Dojkabacteria bacterium]
MPNMPLEVGLLFRHPPDAVLRDARFYTADLHSPIQEDIPPSLISEAEEWAEQIISLLPPMDSCLKYLCEELGELHFRPIDYLIRQFPLEFTSKLVYQCINLHLTQNEGNNSVRPLDPNRHTREAYNYLLHYIREHVGTDDKFPPTFQVESRDYLNRIVRAEILNLPPITLISGESQTSSRIAILSARRPEREEVEKYSLALIAD